MLKTYQFNVCKRNGIQIHSTALV